MEIVFILVAPAVPENVGASCRALKTMGFSQLRLVATQAHRHKQARILAHGSTDILARASTYATLKEALVDVDWVIGTSAKPRHQWRDLTPADALAPLIRAKGNTLHRIALVFGCEESGLSNEQLMLCDQIASIELPSPYPSLNLSQAVMLFAYELRGLNVPNPSEGIQMGGVSAHDTPVATGATAQYAVLKVKLSDVLVSLGFDPGSKLSRWAMEKLPRSDAKAIGFLHALCDKLNRP